MNYTQGIRNALSYLQRGDSLSFQLICVQCYQHLQVPRLLTTHLSLSHRLQHIPIDPPTLSMTFTVNDSPLAGREGTKLTSSVIQERLRKEAESNVSLNIVMQSGGESFEVSQQYTAMQLVRTDTMMKYSPSIL